MRIPAVLLLALCLSPVAACSAGTTSTTSSGGASGGGGGSSGVPADCVPRCEGIVAKCGGVGGDTQAFCADTCSSATASELSCMEAAGCNLAKVQACRSSGSSSSSSGSGSSSSGGGSPKRLGDACTCDAAAFEPGIYKTCLGNTSACFTLDLTCMAEAKTGRGTCVRGTCAKADVGKACSKGGTCRQSGYKAINGEFWYVCE